MAAKKTPKKTTTKPKPQAKPKASAKNGAPPAAAKGKAAAAPNGQTNLVRHERVPRARYEEKLPVAADALEREAAGAEMSKIVDELESFKIEKRETLAELRDRKTGLEQRLNEMSGVWKGKKLTNVLVQEYLIVETATIEVVRTDTGDVVSTRPATKEDLQEQIRTDSADALADSVIAKMTPPAKPSAESGAPGPNDITDPGGVLEGPKLTDGPPRPIEDIVRDNERDAEEHPDEDEDGAPDLRPPS
jgi:hypothetical protein